MKTLLLMRHAEAGPVAEGGDRGRRLTAEGLEAATAMGRFLDELGYLPDLALVSNARRTQETVDGLAPGMRVQPRIEFDAGLYGADAEALIEHVRLHGGDAHCLLIVGHNPAIGDLALTLAGNAAAGKAGMARGFPPGAIAVFTVDAQGWDGFAPGDATLERFITPASLPPKA